MANLTFYALLVRQPADIPYWLSPLALRHSLSVVLPYYFLNRYAITLFYIRQVVFSNIWNFLSLQESLISVAKDKFYSHIPALPLKNRLGYIGYPLPSR